MDIKKALSEKDFKLIAELASTIWNEHYTPIIGIEQVAYMIDKFQSLDAIKKQAQDGMEYFLIFYQNVGVCYFAFTEKKESIFLSKIYVLEKYRGKKIGKTALRFIEGKAKELGYDTISLTVNKNNTRSISAYEKIGFKKIEPIVIDIGKGFIMDDFLMKKNLFIK